MSRNTLIFDTQLSLTGIRRMHLDLTNPLAYLSETLTGGAVSVTSSNISLVTITNVLVSTTTLLNDDGSTAEIGKAVQFTANAQVGSTGRVFLDVDWAVAADGSADTHRIELNLEPHVTS